jgi:hypothetical protein
VFANARGGEWRRRERGRGAAGSRTGTSRRGPWPNVASARSALQKCPTAEIAAPAWPP